ncbi:MAG: O-antigen ligase family protein [Planctomycetes bacterium]|nr:O-antigen ligase family protein [Planctomycetota bacterium]
MSFLEDPILLAFVVLSALFALITLMPRRHSRFWMCFLVLALFALPRGGFVISQLKMPLPVAHILVALCVMEWLLLRQHRFRPYSQFNMVFLIYTAVMGMGLALGLATGGNYLTAFLELCFYLFAIGLFFYVSETFHEKHHFITFMRTILLVAALVSVYGIMQHFWGSKILLDHVTYNSGSEVARGYVENPEFHRRVLSSYGDPNVLASQLIFFLGIVAALVLGKGIKLPMRVLAGGILVLIAFCIHYTGSRAGLVCMVLVLFAVLCWRSRWAWFLLPVMVVVAFMVGPALLESSLAGRFQNIAGAGDLRAQFPQMSFELLKAIPIGCGLGNTVYMDYRGFSWIFEINPTNTLWSGFNSFWLNLFSRLGVPGVVAFAMLLIVLFRYIWKRAKVVEQPDVRAFLYGGLAGFAGVVLIWLVNNTYILPGGGLNFWFMVGMLTAGARAFSAHRYPNTIPQPLPVPISAEQIQPA